MCDKFILLDTIYNGKEVVRASDILGIKQDIKTKNSLVSVYNNPGTLDGRKRIIACKDTIEWLSVQLNYCPNTATQNTEQITTT